MRSLIRDPLPGICACLNERDFTKAFALITGPFETPYEGGLFLFELKFPNDYPNKPPAVQLLTTGSGQTRFNPNLYACGKVTIALFCTYLHLCLPGNDFDSLELGK